MAFNAWPKRPYIMSEDCVYPGDDDYGDDNPWPGEDNNWQEAVDRLQDEIDALSDIVDDITVPQMATQDDMSDWTSGKTVDAATLKTDFQSALLALGDKANASSVYTKTEIDSKGYQTAQQVQAAINAALAQIPFAETEVF